MKITSFLFLIIYSCATCFGQQEELKTLFKDFQYIEDLKLYDDKIFCAGYTFRTSTDDGYSTDAYLVEYDTKTLKPKWSLKFDKYHSNKINSILRFEDKIYVLATQGYTTRNINERKLRISLIIINTKGEIEETVDIGPSFYLGDSGVSNLVLQGKDLYFAYQKPNSSGFSGNPVVSKYNLKTKKITEWVNNKSRFRPKKLISNDSNIYLFGITESQFLYIKDDQSLEKRSMFKRHEYFLNGYVNDNVLTTICIFPGIYGNNQKYLKYYYLNLETNVLDYKVFSYKKFGWDEIRLSTYSNGNSTWIIVKELETGKLKYVLLDHQGNLLNSLDVNYGNGHSEKFIIDDNYQIHAGKGSIRLNKL